MAYEEDEDRVAVVKRHNRVLRKVHKQLRRTLNSATQHSDILFLELCNTDKSAEFAMEKLWTLGQFECGPKDYEYIVERCLDVLGKTKSIDQSASV